MAKRRLARREVVKILEEEEAESLLSLGSMVGLFSCACFVFFFIDCYHKLCEADYSLVIPSYTGK